MALSSFPATGAYPLIQHYFRCCTTAQCVTGIKERESHYSVPQTVDCGRKMDTVSPVPTIVENEAKISAIRPLPSCAVVVVWSQSLHRSDQAAASRYQIHLRTKAQLSFGTSRPIFVASNI